MTDEFTGPVAEIVSVGTEILMGQITDTNARAIGSLLPELGIRHYRRQTVGDNLVRLADALRLALSRSDLVFTIGGLGPTEDDLTREGISSALDDPLIHDPLIEAGVREVFATRRIPWTETQMRQCRRPACAEPINNPNGTAPGLYCEKAGKVLLALPGPRSEFLPMLNGPVREILTNLYPHTDLIISKVLKISGIGESVVESRILELIRSENPTVAPYAHPGDVHLRVTARGATREAARELLAAAEHKVRQEFGTAVYGVDSETLESVIVRLLKARRLKLACAESVSAGGLSARLATVEGCSEVFAGGVIAYRGEVKSALLNVDDRVLEDPSEGAVSAMVAQQMAEGIQNLLHADYALAVTGNAGPTTEMGGKPVGRVYVALSGQGVTLVEEHQFMGSRAAITQRSTQVALAMLYRELADHSESL